MQGQAAPHLQIRGNPQGRQLNRDTLPVPIRIVPD
jgi:hypothetical protein